MGGRLALLLPCPLYDYLGTGLVFVRSIFGFNGFNRRDIVCLRSKLF